MNHKVLLSILEYEYLTWIKDGLQLAFFKLKNKEWTIEDLYEAQRVAEQIQSDISTYEFDLITDIEGKVDYRRTQKQPDSSS